MAIFAIRGPYSNSGSVKDRLRGALLNHIKSPLFLSQASVPNSMTFSQESSTSCKSDLSALTLRDHGMTFGGKHQESKSELFIEIAMGTTTDDDVESRSVVFEVAVLTDGQVINCPLH